MHFFCLHILSIHTILLQFAILTLMVTYNQLSGAWLIILCIIKKKANKCSKQKQSFKLIWMHSSLWVVFLSDSVIESRTYWIPVQILLCLNRIPVLALRCLCSDLHTDILLLEDFLHKKIKSSKEGKIQERRRNPTAWAKSWSWSTGDLCKQQNVKAQRVQVLFENLIHYFVMDL